MPNYLASLQHTVRRDAGAAERTGLENRSRGNSTGGSNPPLSATIQTVSLTAFNDSRHTWYSVGIRPESLSCYHHLLISSKQEASALKKFSLCECTHVSGLTK